MPTSTKPNFEACVAALRSLGAPRVWSMLVSIFGDLAHGPGEHIDGPLLTRLTDGMDIKPEAVRVALHRLRNDGWISSTKSGRTASHAMTKKALTERNLVAPLIYSAASELPDAWQVAILESNDADLRTAATKAGFVPVAQRVFVAHADATAPHGAIVASGNQAADWATDQIIAPELTAQFDQLLTTMTKVRLSLSNAGALTAVETALLRCLIVHHWRRLVLRHPFLPPALIGAAWPGHRCRELVIGALADLPQPALDDLAAEDRRAAS